MLSIFMGQPWRWDLLDVLMAHEIPKNDPWIMEGVQTREVLIALSDRAADKGVHESALHYVEDQRNRERDEG